MSKYSDIVFVSDGGTCRSILARRLYEKINTDRDLVIKSRGMVVLFPEPINAKAEAVAKSKGLDLSDNFSEQLESEDFGEDVLVLVMTDLMKKQVYDKFSEANNVYSIREYVGEALDVEAPFGGELSDYANQYDYVEKLLYKLKDILDEKGGIR